MNFGNPMGSVAMASSGGTRKAADVVTDQFPAGLRVLVVDDDLTCLKILERMLQKCAYEVTKCNRADAALRLLREKRNGYDIVLSDVHMPDMDGFKLLEYIGLEMDLPVIMMSADDGKNVVLKGVTHGACDYLIKPVRIEALKTIWQHVVRKKQNEFKEVDPSGSVEDGDRLQKPSEDADYSSTANEGSWRNSKRRKDEEDDAEDKDDTSTLKKPRVVWSVELHQQFVAAVNQLGADKAVPKKILELMNVPGLTRENVASHLQKYRLYLRRLSGQSQHPNGLTNSFLGHQEATFGQLPSFNTLDLQALAATQIPGQSLATLQAAGFGRSTARSGLPISLVDQRNLFNFESPRIQFEDGQQQRLNSGNKPLSLLHGIPTTMEPKQLANLQHAAQPFGSINMQGGAVGSQPSSLLVHMAQPSSRGQIFNENTVSSVSVLPSSVAPPLLSNGIVSGVLARNGVADDSRTIGYNPVSQAPSRVDFPLNQITELPGNAFPLGNNIGMSSLKPKGIFQEEISSEMKVSRGLSSSYNILSDLHPQKSQNWDLQSIGLNFDASQHASTLEGSSPPVLVQQGFSGQVRGQNRNTSCIPKTNFSSAEEIGIVNPQTSQQLNTVLVDNPSRIKVERTPELGCETAHAPGNFGHDDLLSQLLKQQEGLVPDDGEFDLDGFAMDNIPV